MPNEELTRPLGLTSPRRSRSLPVLVIAAVALVVVGAGGSCRLADPRPGAWHLGQRSHRRDARHAGGYRHPDREPPSPAKAPRGGRPDPGCTGRHVRPDRGQADRRAHRSRQGRHLRPDPVAADGAAIDPGPRPPRDRRLRPAAEDRHRWPPSARRIRAAGAGQRWPAHRDHRGRRRHRCRNHPRRDQRPARTRRPSPSRPTAQTLPKPNPPRALPATNCCSRSRSSRMGIRRPTPVRTR